MVCEAISPGPKPGLLFSQEIFILAAYLEVREVIDAL